MKAGKLLVIFAILFCLSLVFSSNGRAAKLTGRASTIAEWYDDANEDLAVPVYQYLLLNIRDIDDDGLNFKGYGRLAVDTRDVIDVDSRLYYAFLEKKGLFNDRADLRFGRQFVATTAGASLMDGLDLSLKNVGPLKFRFFGGGDATFYNGYDADDLMWGAEISSALLENKLNLGASYLQKWEGSRLTKELIGLDFDYDEKKLLNLYSEVQLNYINNVVSYFLLGGKYYRDPKWQLRAEYLYSLPVFSSTSIYSVFAVYEYREAMAEFTYNIALGLRAFGRYTREFYEEYDDADVFEAGIEKIRTARFAGYLAGVYRNDEDGHDLKGFKARAAWMFNKMIQAGIGANVDVLDRRVDLDNDEDETTSHLVWIDTTLFLNDRMNLQLKLERAESGLWDEYYRGRVRFNMSF